MSVFDLKPTDGTKGVVYIAFGKQYDKVGAISAKRTVKKCKLPICVLTNLPKNKRCKWPRKTQFIGFDLPNRKNRQVRTQLYKYTPFDYTFHLDADSVIANRKASLPLGYLGNWDMCFVVTRDGLGGKESWPKIGSVLKSSRHFIFTGGAIYFKKNDRVTRFFDIWNKRWIENGMARDMDVLYQAIWESEVRILCLPGSKKWFGKKGKAYIQHDWKGVVSGLPNITKYKPDGDGKRGKRTVWKKVQ